jgi:uncharacterized protein (TIGR02453 family)
MAGEVLERFDGFSAEGLAFLRGLAKHNDRAWFAPRKPTYETQLLAPLRAFVDELSGELARQRVPIGGEPRRAIFRIYRDVRFSPDKRPYKTHVSAYLSPSGGRGTPGGLYVHIQPGESFMAAAFHELDSPLLLRFRQAIVADPKRFRTMARALERKGLALPGPDEQEGALKRLPRGFSDAPAEVADYLRLRSFTVHRELSDADVASRKLIGVAARFAKDSLPLLRYGWSL